MKQQVLDFQKVREIRHREPQRVKEMRANRQRRDIYGADGKLFIIAADHPARGAISVGADQKAMANRYELLQRLSIALENEHVDGVLATPDILDDLLIMGLLENKVVVGSVNRGGLKDSVFEIDDRVTATTPKKISQDRYDFAKTLVRIYLQEPETVGVLEAMAKLVDEAVEHELPIMLEPFLGNKVNGFAINDLSLDAVIKSVAISSGLGASSEYSWLKLPVIDGMEEVMQATTLPTLLLGGEQSDNPQETYRAWDRSLELPGVHGLVVGRTLLYPKDGDVRSAISQAAHIVHGS